MLSHRLPLKRHLLCSRQRKAGRREWGWGGIHHTDINHSNKAARRRSRLELVPKAALRPSAPQLAPPVRRWPRWLWGSPGPPCCPGQRPGGCGEGSPAGSGGEAGGGR